MTHSFRIDAMVREYHVYKDIWDASSAIGDEFNRKREPGNRNDTHAVAITKEDVTIGHVPRAISPICSIFIRRGGTIKCLITGGRCYLSDLPQGGLEIPYVLIFKSTKAKECLKTQGILGNAGFEVSPVPQQRDSNGRSNVFEDSTKKSVVKLAAAAVAHSCSLEPSPQVELTTKDVQVKVQVQSRYIDTEHIIMGEKLSDGDINHAQKILKAQFPKLNGLRLTLYQDRPSEQVTDNWVQVIHCLRRDHWILATTINCDDGMVLIYDSVFRNVDEPTKRVLYNVFPSCTKVKVSGKTQNQKGGYDCGLYALAFATSLAFGIDPASQVYDQNRMKRHLANCFEANKFSQFPCLQD